MAQSVAESHMIACIFEAGQGLVEGQARCVQHVGVEAVSENWRALVFQMSERHKMRISKLMQYLK